MNKQATNKKRADMTNTNETSETLYSVQLRGFSGKVDIAASSSEEAAKSFAIEKFDEGPIEAISSIIVIVKHPFSGLEECFIVEPHFSVDFKTSKCNIDELDKEIDMYAEYGLK